MGVSRSPSSQVTKSPGGAPGLYSVLTVRLGYAGRPGLAFEKTILRGISEMETVW